MRTDEQERAALAEVADNVVQLPRKIRPLTLKKPEPMSDRELLHRMGALITDVADGIEDEGDRAYFGSANDASDLIAMRDEWFLRRSEADDFDDDE